MHDYKKLDVWNLTIELVTEVYRITDSFPKTEVYAITTQIRRSAVSIPSNIAEGAGRKSEGQFKVFLGYAYGSSCEFETQLIISEKLKYIDSEALNILSKKIASIQNMIYKLIESLNN
jgi:four helix bundle protein